MRRAKQLAAMALCLLTTGCVVKWEPQYGPVPQTAAANQGSTARLVMNDGTGMEIRNMRVEGDSIVGETGNPPQRVAVATENVRVISVRRQDAASPVNTGLKVLGVVAIAFIAAGVFAMVWINDQLS